MLSTGSCTARLVVFAAVLAATPAKSRDIEPEPFPLELIADQSPIEVLVSVPQNELRMQYVPEFNLIVARTPGIVAGLVEGMLERRRKRNAIKKVADINELMLDAEFNRYALQASKHAFSVNDWAEFDLKSGYLRVSDASETLANLDGKINGLITFEYAIDPTFTRTFVGCTLRILSPSKQSDDKETSSEIDVIYMSVNQYSTEVSGLPKKKKARRDAFKTGGGRFLRQLIEENISGCAHLAAESVSLDLPTVRNLIDNDATVVSTSQNAQFAGWLVDGQSNLYDGRYGPFGIKKTFVRAGTQGTTLYTGRNGQFRHRVVAFQDLDANLEVD